MTFRVRSPTKQKFERVGANNGAGTVTLQDYLAAWTNAAPARAPVAEAVGAMAEASIVTAETVANGSLAGELGRVTARAGEFDEQKAIDLIANDIIVAALWRAPVAAFASEELAEPMTLDPAAPLLVAADPLDGSSNVDANISFGMIFSVLPSHPASTGVAAFLRPGTQQLAAGLVVYGPHTAFALTVGAGTQVFTLDRATRSYILTKENVAIPHSTAEYAINTSNARFWEDPIRIYIHDCENGVSGPRGHDYNMRWTGSPVADVSRILTRGGIYLYPSDNRKGFHQGRIRLVYEANPIALLIEQAGGLATTGSVRVLEVVPTALHQKTPLICGSSVEVDHVARLYSGSDLKGERSALFGRRGLFRA